MVVISSQADHFTFIEFSYMHICRLTGADLDFCKGGQNEVKAFKCRWFAVCKIQ